MEPVFQGRYAIVALETSALGFKNIKVILYIAPAGILMGLGSVLINCYFQASKEYVNKWLTRGIHGLWVRYYPDYPKSIKLPGMPRNGGGKGKVRQWHDYVHAG